MLVRVMETTKPLRKRLNKIGLLQGYVLSFGGPDGGPHGDRWSIYVTWPHTRWVETNLGKHDWYLTKDGKIEK